MARLHPMVTPANAYLWFAQAYDFEHYAANVDPNYYDGGVLEYSKNGGTTWVDAGTLMDYNGYKGKTYPSYMNPLQRCYCLVGSGARYISTRLNLASLGRRAVASSRRSGL